MPPVCAQLTQVACLPREILAARGETIEGGLYSATGGIPHLRDVPANFFGSLRPSCSWYLTPRSTTPRSMSLISLEAAAFVLKIAMGSPLTNPPGLLVVWGHWGRLDTRGAGSVPLLGPPRRQSVQLFAERDTQGWEPERYLVKPAPGVEPSIHSASFWWPKGSQSIKILWTTGFSGLVNAFSTNMTNSRRDCAQSRVSSDAFRKPLLAARNRLNPHNRDLGLRAFRKTDILRRLDAIQTI